MFEKMTESSGNVVGYKAIGDLTKADYTKLEQEVKALVEKQGSIRMMFDMTQFKWEKAEAWIPDMKFGSEFHKKIDKMAIVGDKRWEKWLASVAKHFYAKDAKYFPSADTAKAWAWLRE
jgi:hypothetical protein